MHRDDPDKYLYRTDEVRKVVGEQDVKQLLVDAFIPLVVLFGQVADPLKTHVGLPGRVRCDEYHPWRRYRFVVTRVVLVSVVALLCTR